MDRNRAVLLIEKGRLVPWIQKRLMVLLSVDWKGDKGGRQEKRRKMDRIMTQQCTTLLNALMKHPAGWVFNQPVDPIALRIPDYFSIIKNPMDLGTIKSKLAKKAYLSVEEFVADIKLTFSNAMLYNPPSNNVHKMAEEMDGFFEVRWKSLEEKWNAHEKISSVQLNDVGESRQGCPKIQLSRKSSLPKKSNPSEEKAVNMTSNVKAEVHLPKLAQNRVSNLSGKNLQKGTSTANASGGFTNGSICAKPPLSSIAGKCSSCGSIKCQCSIPCDSHRAPLNVATSERLLAGDPRVFSADASKLDCQAKGTSTSQMNNSDPDSDGDVSAIDEGNVYLSSHLATPVTDASSGEVLTTPNFDAQNVTKKALRAAMLKSRFADTILKAQQRTLLDHGDKANPVKLQQEKEKLEKRQREEKAKIEAQIRAAEATAKMKAETELKRQRELEREAARLALQKSGSGYSFGLFRVYTVSGLSWVLSLDRFGQLRLFKMEKTAEIEQNLEILKELETLIGCENPLHKLGLFFKDEFLDENEPILNEESLFMLSSSDLLLMLSPSDTVSLVKVVSIETRYQPNYNHNEVLNTIFGQVLCRAILLLCRV
ncbi:bidirectional sugar transporter SWEET2a-like isoform X1 [Hibiscus syriacus]|uniref:Bidirectional sugar transporter SWEET2a-like isoform X1 n=1 Tax=Hibiscus syriacus TaxID=106335 RepID=A0A6A3BV91_HIBSY|nr:bidirectional sugar transporter SWEET2a-like isoform X1 [Hibiscus syriacus]